MGTIKRKKRHARPGPKVDLIEIAMCGADQPWTPEELAAIKHEAERIGAEKWFEGFLAEHEAWTPPPEVVLSDSEGLAILEAPVSHSTRVPAGFHGWLRKQPDGEQLYRDWLESIRQAQIEKRNVNA